MGSESEKQSIEEEWQVAQAALVAAQKMPGGPERINALKLAGKLRYDADKRRRKIREGQTDKAK